MKNLSSIILFALLSVFIFSCEQNELLDLDAAPLSDREIENQNIALEESAIEKVDSIIFKESELESRSNLIYEYTASIHGGNWFLVYFHKHNLHSNCKYIAKITTFSGDPDLYVHGRNQYGDYRKIRQANANNGYEETYAYLSDLQHDESKLYFSVYADQHRYANFKIQIFKDCSNGNGGGHTCCSNNPLSQHWLQNVISGICSNQHIGTKIWCATYNGQTVINKTAPTNFPDLGGTLYDCNGNVVKHYGFYGPGGELNGTLTNHTKIWDTQQCGGNSGGSCVIVNEDFQNYHGEIRHQANWGTWSNTNSATINGHPLEYNGKVLGFNSSYGKQSAVRFLNNANSGVYLISWDMNIEHGSNAGFGLYSKNSGSNYSPIRTVNITSSSSKGFQRHYTCKVDFDNRKITISVDQALIYQGSIPYNTNLGLFSFHSLNAYHGNFYVDNFKVVKENCGGHGSNASDKSGSDNEINMKEVTVVDNIETVEF